MEVSRLDKRTRTSADIRDIDVTDFFERELPSLIESRSYLAFDGASEFTFGSLTVHTESGSWTLTQTEDSFAVARNDSGEAAIRITDTEFGDFVNDLTTLQMQLSLGRVTLERGARSDVNCWQTVLRSFLDNRAFYTRGSVTFKDRHGRPLDLTRSFTPDDDDADIAHFLEEAGFLHLSGWLDKEAMDAISADIDRVLPTCTPEDGSWWATLEDGTRRPVRIVDFAQHSEALRKILASDAYQRVGRLTDDGYRSSALVEALHKPLGVVEGISNIPWHNDCTQGMHSYCCTTIVVGISVTDGGPDSSQLGVVPGSHRALMPVDHVYPQTGFEPLFLSTRAGDMTVHCSCTMHMAKAPTNFERKLLYTTFDLPNSEPRKVLEERKVYQDRDKAQRLASKGQLTMEKIEG